MKERERILYWAFVVVLLFVYVSCLLNEGVYQVCIWRDLDYTLSWQVLKTVQIMLVPPVAGLLLLSLYYKLWKKKPLKGLPFNKKNRTNLMIMLLNATFFILFHASAAPVRKTGYPFEVYRLARAHGLLLLVLAVGLNITASLLGVWDKSVNGTGDGSLAHAHSSIRHKKGKANEGIQSFSSSL